jgi:Beta-galactosidase
MKLQNMNNMKNLLCLIIVLSGIVMVSCQHNGKESITAVIDYTKIDPGKYDSTWWNRAPYRLVQTNLREIDATMDVDAYVKSMVDANVNIVLINVGGIVANYPTELPYQYRNTFMKGDLVGDLINGLHDKGIRVIGRFDFSKINETLAAKKPEWLYVSTSGKNVNYNGQVHTCVNGGYQQDYSLEILTEALSKYPLDGIFFNMIGYTTSDYSGNNHGICQCDNCKKAFHKFSGHALPVRQDMNDPVFIKYNEFKKITSNELFNKIGNHIKTLNPALMINTYTDTGVDMIASESSSEVNNENEWNYSATDNVKRVLGSYKDRSPGNLLIYFQAIGYRHVGTSPHLAKVWMLENMLHGAPLGFVVIGTLVNYEDRVFIPTLNSLYGFHKTNEKLFTNVQSVNKIALIRGSRDEYQGIIKMLTEEHIMYDIIELSAIGSERLPRQINEYEAIILGEVTNMDEKLINTIDEYVNKGGKVLTTGFTSTRDEFGNQLNNIRLKSLGVKPAYELFPREKSSYLKISDDDKKSLGANEFKDFSIMMMYSDYMKCQTEANATKYMRFLPATKFGPPEKCYFTNEEITDFPGLIYNTYGKGKSVFIPWKIGTQYRQKGHYMHKTLFISALRNLLKVENTIITNASPLIEMTHIANRNGAFEWLGLINHSGQIGGSYLEPTTISNINIRFKPTRKVNKMYLLNSGTTLDFRQKDSWIECTVPHVKDFEMILCQYE